MADVVDGFISLLAGMNAGVDPGDLSPNAYAFGANVTSRGGRVATRPGFSLLTSWSGAVFQGAGRWSLNAGDLLVGVVDGAAQVFRAADGTVVTALPGLLSATAQCHFCQVDDRLLIMDGVSGPLVLEIDADWTVVTAYQGPTAVVPVCLTPGVVCAYAHGRIHYVPSFVPDIKDTDGDGVPDILTTNGRTCLVSSDIKLVEDPDTVFKMTEHVNLDEGGALALPFETGFIEALAPLRNAATGTGVGPLVVFGREGVSAFDLSSPRDQWHDIALSQVLFYGAGTRSPRSVVSVNGDLIFVDTEGQIRTVRYTGSELTGSITNTSISNELYPYLTTVMLTRASASFSDNRLLATTRYNASGFKALAALDFAPTFALGSKPSAMYDGFWTGFVVQQALAARRGEVMTHFLIAEKANGGFAVLYLDSAARDDLGSTPIQATLVTRRMFSENLADVKELQYVEMDVGGVESDAVIEVLYRPDQYPYWASMGSKSIQVPGGPAQYRRRLRFAVDFSNAPCQDVSKELLFAGLTFQFAIKISGHVRIDRLRAVATLRGEAPPDCGLDNVEDLAYSAGTELDYFGYEVPL